LWALARFALYCKKRPVDCKCDNIGQRALRKFLYKCWGDGK
jgi:hypothetical protein